MMKIARVVALAAAVLVGRSATAQEFADLNKPITLDLGLLPFVKSLEPIGGWPLTIRMLANKPLGIGTEPRSSAFPPYLNSGPGLAGKAWIVWSDPDKVFSFGCVASQWSPPCPAADETVLEFTPGLPTKGGTAAAPPKVNNWDYANANHVGNTTNTPTSIGPSTGYGSSPAVPGLVILSDTGVGLDFVPDATFGIRHTGAVRNLAGFVNSVSWTLNDRMPLLPRTSVTAEMNVPYGLFKPILFMDRNGTLRDSNGLVLNPNYMWTIDGGPVTTGGDNQMRAALNAKVTTVRIFVLDGAAPDHFDDMNGDGIVDSRDALLTTNPATGLKYKLLSGERVIRFQTLVEEEFPGIEFDFDGNGMTPPVAPPGGGTIKTPPR
jgi:hypothetical protein